MRWSSRVGDLAKLLFVVGPHAPDCSLQRLTANLSGSNPYTTPVDVNRTILGASDGWRVGASSKDREPRLPTRVRRRFVTLASDAVVATFVGSGSVTERAPWPILTWKPAGTDDEVRADHSVGTLSAARLGSASSAQTRRRCSRSMKPASGGDLHQPVLSRSARRSPIRVARYYCHPSPRVARSCRSRNTSNRPS